MSTILLTGAAGFIGFHLTRQLLRRGERVIGVDNLNEYYDVRLKQDRLAQVEGNSNFSFHLLGVEDRPALAELFERERPDTVLHLAAQAGVRYSLQNPHAYADSNLVGFLNVLEGCRQSRVKHLVFASSSSVYGANRKIPFSAHDHADHPVSLYAATKKANELMAHSYSYLYGIPATGLRFFTVYGPWGRPDMALFSFTKSILRGEPIDVFNYGDLRRDFTYIDDIAETVVRVLDHPPQPDLNWSAESPDPATSPAPYRIFNIGHSQPVNLLRFIEILEDALGRKAVKNLLPMQPGDVKETQAETSDLEEYIGFAPRTPLETGLPKFVDWYRQYYGV